MTSMSIHIWLLNSIIVVVLRANLLLVSAVSGLVLALTHLSGGRVVRNSVRMILRSLHLRHLWSSSASFHCLSPVLRDLLHVLSMQHTLRLVDQNGGRVKLHWLIQINVQLRELELARKLPIGSLVLLHHHLRIEIVQLSVLNAHFHGRFSESLVDLDAMLLLAKVDLAILILRSLERWEWGRCISSATLLFGHDAVRWTHIRGYHWLHRILSRLNHYLWGVVCGLSQVLRPSHCWFSSSVCALGLLQ